MIHLRWLLLPVLVVSTGFCFATASERPIVGFVEMPAVFGRSDSNGPPGQVAPDTFGDIPLYALPTVESPMVGKVTDPTSVAYEEFRYEERAAAVYDVADGWALLRLTTSSSRQFGWIAPENVGQFHALEEHIVNGLSYLTGEWDRQLYDEPAGSASAVQSRDALGQTPDIDVLKISGTGKEAWLFVEVLRQGRCLGAEDPEVLVKGWVKVHSADGRPNVWFYPRGC